MWLIQGKDKSWSFDYTQQLIRRMRIININSRSHARQIFHVHGRRRMISSKNEKNTTWFSPHRGIPLTTTREVLMKT